MSKIETPRPIRGTQDIFGAEAEAFAHVVETFERVRKLYRFRRVEMPVFEKTEVFCALARRDHRRGREGDVLASRTAAGNC